MQFYQQSQEAVLESLNSSTQGLTQEEAEKRREIYGANALTEHKSAPLWRLFLDAFLDPMMLILTVLVFVQWFLGEWVESLVILGVLLLNALISVVQTKKAESSLNALREMAAPTAKVRRNGVLFTLVAKEILPGDVILLEAGDLVPADGRILHLSALKVNEGMLTGESEPVLKSDEILAGTLSIGDQKNMVFGGSIVLHGHAEVIITATGKHAQIGQIAALIESAEKRQTPLQERLTHFSKRLGLMIFALCVVIFLIQTARILESGGDLERGLLDALMFSIAVAVAAIPEALSSVITILLARGTKKMAKENAIIRKLPTVESLGSASVICTDKTGTLTQNKMTVQDSFLCDDDNLTRTSLFLSMVLCNDAQIGADDVILGDPTEIALLEYAVTQGCSPSEIRQKHRRILDLPFDSGRKRMSVLYERKGEPFLFTKGAPDVLFPLCTHVLQGGQAVPFDLVQQKRFQEQNERFSEKAYRVLAFCVKKIPEHQATLSVDDETALTLIGLVAMIDPPREEVYAAIETARGAGMKTIMITGDHKTTALAIAKKITLADEDTLALTGTELDALSDEALTALLPRVAVFARVSPEHKIRIVKTWQRLGHIVAMTGDGVNDAPSLKQADIGIAMGSGTEVSKDASAMILTDDNFSSIVSAIGIGRTIFDNIKKAISYLFSGNLAGIIAILFALFVGWDKPLTALQILFINLINDTLPAIAIGFEPPEANILMRAPRDKNEGIFAGGLLQNVVVRGTIMGILTILAQFWGTHYFSPQIGGAMAFSTLLLCRTLQTFNARSNSESLYKLGLLSNPYTLFAVIACLLMYGLILLPGMREVFYLPVDFSLPHIAISFGLALFALFLMEALKFARAKSRRNQ